MSNSPLSLEQFVRAIPKVELHCHLFGTVRQDTFRALAAKTNNVVTPEEIDAFYTRGEKPVGVLRVLRALDAHLIVAPADLYCLTYEYLEDAHSHGVRYAEFFWNPTGTVRVSGIRYEAAQDAIVAAIRDARRDFGVIGRLIPSIDREAPPEEALQMVEWMKEFRAPEVIGIGIDYRENDRPPELFLQAYRAAREAGFKCTAHAGEFGMPWMNVATAVDALKVDRVDHGYTIVDNPELARQYAERGLVFTVVPTNSYYLRTLAPERWALDHPIRAMAKLGLKLHPNTDDPTLHHVTPTGAWLMMREFGFGIDDMRAFMLNGLDGAWIDEATRQAWRTEFAATFDALRARLVE
ncbi:adenosine deaminase [Janthinobacterium sp.]|uniref:adenosine deaminase family protein n=1 Tax=Janthinobacterium sp. TaxID=1871054 RepID=UPI002896AA27|nr:adenosine deaminase [Janthinobacterium sp.]